ncbi:MAG: hypothetical protein V4467_02040 [Patescibacteria group bacterium]
MNRQRLPSYKLVSAQAPRPLAQALNEAGIQIIDRRKVAAHKREYRKKVCVEFCRYTRSQAVEDFLGPFLCFAAVLWCFWFRADSWILRPSPFWAVPIGLILSAGFALIQAPSQRRSFEKGRRRDARFIEWQETPLEEFYRAPQEARRIYERVSKLLPGVTATVHWLYTDPFLEVASGDESYFILHWDE